MDNSDAEPSGAFDISIRRAFERILPEQRFARLDSKHVIYKSFYLVDQQAGRTIRVPYLENIEIDNRAAIPNQNDLAGAWSETLLVVGSFRSLRVVSAKKWPLDLA